jgi:DnaJ homolog subfamily C member 7
MGFELGNVLSDESHWGDFTCVICQQIIDLNALVTTPCSHCFCHQCLTEWVERATNPNKPDGMFTMYGEIPSAPKCPTCSHSLLYSQSSQQHYASMMIGQQAVTIQPLQTFQPLAYRILKRIRVKCPLSSRVGCAWEGDYGDMKEHLLSKTAHDGCDVAQVNLTATANTTCTGPCTEQESNNSPTSMPARSEQERHHNLALSFKDEGNDQFASGHIDEAKELYTRALSMLSESTDDSRLKATCYANRAAAWLTLEMYSNCIQDCNMVLQIDPAYFKAYVRKAKAMTQQGQLQQVVDAWAEAAEKCPQGSLPLIKKEQFKAEALLKHMLEGKQHLKEGSFAGAKAAFSRVLMETSAPDALVGAAKADLGLGLTESAMRLSHQIIRGATDHVAEGYEIRGACLFLMGDFEGGQKLISEALRQAPDLKSAQNLRKNYNKVVALVKQARDQSFHRRFEEAVKSYTLALDEVEILPLKSTLYGILYTERAEVYLRLKQYDRALKEVSTVLHSRDDYKHAWLVKLQALHGLGRHTAAKSDAENLMQRWGSNDTEIRQAYTKADFEVRKQNRPDLYGLLGVSSMASELEIKAAYNRKIAEWHPDNYAEAPAAAQKAAAERHRLLGDALEILCDDFKRQLYDEGYDHEGIQERIERARRAAKSN